MKKVDRRKLENKVRALELDSVCDNGVRMEEIKRRAYEEYMRRQLSIPSKPKQTLRRNVMVVAAATAGIMVFSFAYSVFAPVAVSSANQQVRRATLWINNAFHLGFEFPEPVEDTAMLMQESSQSYPSLESAAKALSIPLLYVDQTDDLRLDRVETLLMADGIISAHILYLGTEGNFSISISPLGDESIIAPLLSDAISMDTGIGEMIAWETASGSRASIVYKGYMVQFSSTIPYQSFLSICESIKEFS